MSPTDEHTGVAGTGTPAGSNTTSVRNPATGQFVAEVAMTPPQAMPALAQAARVAQPEWARAGFAERGRVMLRMRRWIVDNQSRVVSTLMSETGKTYEDAALAEIGYAVAALGHWTRKGPRQLADRRVPGWHPILLGHRLASRYEPYGLVGVIGPWNYPLINSFGDCVPALVAGNAVILKPSEITPLTSLLMRDALDECGLPAGVFQVAVGGPETGEALVDAVDMVMFTGSTATGRKVAERAARTLTPVSLELGGKDPMIVLADADLDRAANAAVYSSMQNSGQSCTSIERVYVEAPVYDQFIEKVTGQVRALRQGAPAGPASVDVGAMIFPPQVEIVERHVEEAVAHGARVLTGGASREGEGRFFEPTVLVDVDHSMELMREETFGPTLPVMRVTSAEEALVLANDSAYGLSASVWTRDRARGEKLARRIEAGTVLVNDSQINFFAFDLPLGGWKGSGLGVRHGAEGIRKYCRQQSVIVTWLSPFKRGLHMLPYTRPRTRLLGWVMRALYGRGGR